MHVAFLLAASLGRPGSEGARSAARVARWVVAAVFALLLATATPAQTHRPLPDLAPEQIATPGANVVPPRPIVAPNAAYTDSARRAQYEGTARVEFVVDSNGNVRNLSVIQDLPYGLGVAAREAVRTWKFQPATLNGKPVAYRGATEMEFRLVQSPARPAQPSLAQRLENAIADLQAATDSERKRGLQQLEELAGERYPPAMFHLGSNLMEGGRIPRDEAKGHRLLASAAEDLDPDALAYQWARVFDAAELDAGRNQAAGMIERMRTQGSGYAEVWLASRFWIGDYRPQDLIEARRRFRACSLRGQHLCLLTWFIIEADQIQKRDARKDNLFRNQAAMHELCRDLTNTYTAAAKGGSKVAAKLEPIVQGFCAKLAATR